MRLFGNRRKIARPITTKSPISGIGYWNISINNRGMMGYRTPKIDRIAKEGAAFTDPYGQQSCTGGRAAFITGQSCFRTGLLKVGLPGAKEGLDDIRQWCVSVDKPALIIVDVLEKVRPLPKAPECTI